jgi:hypothetical protein
VQNIYRYGTFSPLHVCHINLLKSNDVYTLVWSVDDKEWNVVGLSDNGWNYNTNIEMYIAILRLEKSLK